MSIVAPAYGHHYAVSAGHEYAAQAAVEVLEGGGNAIDAGVAAVLTLGVVYSDQVSIAGVAPMMVHLAESGQTWTVAGVGGWPQALEVERFIAAHGGSIPPGVQRCVVPAAPDACLQALSLWGTLTYSDVARRAIGYARDGFPRHHVMVDYLQQFAGDYRQWPDNLDIWLPGGEVPAIGSRFVQRDLAATLQFLCDQERSAAGGRLAGLDAVHDAFYRGDIASAMISHVRDHGGLLSAADLASFRCAVTPSLSRRVCLNDEAVEVHTCGAWSQGPTLLAALNVIEGFAVTALGHNSAEYLHILAETLKLALADREAYIGDPAFVDVPLAALLSENYGASQRARIDLRHASPGLPAPGIIDGYRPFLSQPDEGLTRPMPDTSIVAVIDQQGNSFCATPSDPSWDTPVVPGTGLVISSRGSQSRAVAGHPACLAPGKRPRLTPNPCFARVAGRWIMPFGTPGGDTQVQANLQLLLNHLSFKLPLQDAIEAPRLMTHSQPDSFAPNRSAAGRVTVEGRVAESACTALGKRGHKIERVAEWTHWMAGLCAVKKDLRSGQLEAGADPRRGSRAMAW